MIFTDYLKFILHVNTFFGSPAYGSRSFSLPEGSWLCALSLENSYGSLRNVRYAKLSGISPFGSGAGGTYVFIDIRSESTIGYIRPNGPFVIIGPRTITAEAEISGDVGVDFMFHFFRLPNITAQ